MGAATSPAPDDRGPNKRMKSGEDGEMGGYKGPGGMPLGPPSRGPGGYPYGPPGHPAAMQQPFWMNVGGPQYGGGPPPPPPHGWGQQGPLGPPPGVYGAPDRGPHPPPGQGDWSGFRKPPPGSGGPSPRGPPPNPKGGGGGDGMDSNDNNDMKGGPPGSAGRGPQSYPPPGPGGWNPGAPGPGWNYGPGPPPGYGGPGGPPPHMHQPSSYGGPPHPSYAHQSTSTPWGGGAGRHNSPSRGGPRPIGGGPPGMGPREIGMGYGGGAPGSSGGHRVTEVDMSYMSGSRSHHPPSLDDDCDRSSTGGSTKEKGRGSYKCGRCGVPKKGHVCPYQPKLKRRADEPPPVLRNAAVQVEMDEFMTLRRLNIKIQGLPESYATEPYMGESMVIAEPHSIPGSSMGIPPLDGRGGTLVGGHPHQAYDGIGGVPLPNDGTPPDAPESSNTRSDGGPPHTMISTPEGSSNKAVMEIVVSTPTNTASADANTSPAATNKIKRDAAVGDDDINGNSSDAEQQSLEQQQQQTRTPAMAEETTVL